MRARCRSLSEKYMTVLIFFQLCRFTETLKRKKANLRMMLEYAEDYEKNSDGGLSGFLRYIDRIMESKGDFKAVSGSSGSQNAVSVKTMHKSKGLEYPFIFIAETSTKFSRLDKMKPFQFSYESGLDSSCRIKKNMNVLTHCLMKR